MIPESENAKATRFEKCGSSCISNRAGCVLAAVNFDNETRAYSCKIHKEWADRMLAAEFHILELASSKCRP